MQTNCCNPAKLVLDDGTVLFGKSIGSRVNKIGELVFNTAMTGYVETLTDPSFFGQIVVQTFPEIGNYGVCFDDCEAKNPGAFGFIVKQLSTHPFNFRNQQKLGEWLVQNHIAAISDIDTRTLTKKIRQGEVKNCAIIADFENENLQNWNELLKTYRVDMKKSAVSEVSTKTIKRINFQNFKKISNNFVLNNQNIKKTNFKICLFDFGTKASIVANLALRCKEVLVLPHNTTVDELKQLEPDGIVLSNGPGDPAINTELIETVAKIQQLKIPIFGICLGHQLLALANGAKTMKLKFGHRGTNQPVVETSTGKMFITAQNHGYVVDSSTIEPEIAKISFSNVNDRTCEGLEFLKFPAFSVQFHPEACSGPLDCNFLFDKFFQLIENVKNNSA